MGEGAEGHLCVGGLKSGQAQGAGDGLMLASEPKIPAVVRISRKRAGAILASLGIVIGVVAAWYGSLIAFLSLDAILLPLAAVTYHGLSNESNVSIERGHVFVYPKVMGTGGLELWFESICKPKKIRVEGDAGLVSSGVSELRIVFENEGTKELFVSEVTDIIGP